MMLAGAVMMAVALMMYGGLNEHEPFHQVFLWAKRLVVLTFFSGAAISSVGLIISALN